jgi:hypothetical protein
MLWRRLRDERRRVARLRFGELDPSVTGCIREPGTSTMLDPKRDATMSIRPLVVALALGIGACGWSEVAVESNGEEGALFLRHATYGDPCGPAAVVPSCGDELACIGLEDLYVGTHDFQVVRWLRVSSGNGLGDSNTVSDYQDLGPADRIAVSVSPADAAAVEVVRTCADAVRLSLEILQPSAFELVVATEQHSDRWTIEPIPQCRPCP